MESPGGGHLIDILAVPRRIQHTAAGEDNSVLVSGYGTNSVFIDSRMQIVVELCLVETIHLFIEQVEQNLVIPEVGHIEKGDMAVGTYGQEVFVAYFFQLSGKITHWRT